MIHIAGVAVESLNLGGWWAGGKYAAPPVQGTAGRAIIRGGRRLCRPGIPWLASGMAGFRLSNTAERLCHD